MGTKRTIDVRLYPNSTTKFNTDKGWSVSHSYAGLQVNYGGKAVSVEFLPKGKLAVQVNNIDVDNGDFKETLGDETYK